MDTDPTLSQLLEEMLASRLAPAARTWLGAACAEIGRDGSALSDERFGALLSIASRHARGTPLAPTDAERRRAEAALEGLEIERWTLLEALRVRLILARGDLARPSAVRALEAAFQFADEGELCALYRSLALLPDAARFAARAAEGCRSNMRSVFEAIACDNPFPLRWFDDLAFNQCVIKAIFIGAPVARIFGLERRRTPELARMALDLAAERRSAGRPVPDDLWLALDPQARAAARNVHGAA